MQQKTFTGTGVVALGGIRPDDGEMLVQLSGTYGTVTFTLQGSVDGTNYANVVAIDDATGLAVNGGTTIAPSDNSTVIYKIPTTGLSTVGFNVGAIASGTGTISYSSYPSKGTTVQPNTANPATTVALVDNTAVAFQFAEATNAYETFVTSNGTESVNFGQKVLVNNATTPILEIATGMTNTGRIDIKGKTSGIFRLTTADATAQTLTLSVAAQTTGAATVSIPDCAGAAQTLVTLALTQTLTNKTLTAPTLTTPTTTSRALNQLLAIGPAPTDTYSATMTIDVTKSLHVISAANGTSATVTFTPSAAGSAGDILVILTTTDGSGTVTATFASTFHPNGTQATT